MAGDGDPVPRAPHPRGRAGPAAGLPGLCPGLCLYRFPRSSGHRANHAARPHRLGAARLLVPRDPLHRRRGGDADLRALSLTSTCWRARRSCSNRRPPISRRARWAQGRGARSSRSRCPWRARPSRAGAAGADGDARRFRHRVLFRRPDLRHRHLPAGSPSSTGRRRRSLRCVFWPFALVARHAGARQRGIAAPRRRAAVRGDAARRADRAAAKRRRALHAAGLLRFSPAQRPCCDHGVGFGPDPADRALPRVPAQFASSWPVSRRS
jgi:hypothetical protein